MTPFVSIHTRHYYRFLVMVVVVLCMEKNYGYAQGAGSVLLENNGSIRNTGIIRVSGLTRGNTSATAFIDNRGGIMRFEGNAFLRQDTLLGRAEFVMNTDQLRQFVPQITYSSIHMTGASIKILDSVGHARNLVSLDTLLTDASSEISMGQQYEIIARGHIQHDGFINRAFTHGKVQMVNRVNEVNTHNISGRGEFKRLELNNLSGADVISGGGFSVRNQLDLTRGEFRNSTANNFRVGDEALIVRTVNASLRTEPTFEGRVNVRYIGTGATVAGGEIPSFTAGSAGRLQDLEVLNTVGLTIQKTMTVNRSMTVASKVFTETQDKIDTLVYTAQRNPVYLTDTSEVIGVIRRVNLAVGDSTLNLFHNQHTYVSFPNAASQGAVRTISLRVLPNSIPIPTDNVDSRNKVRRAFDMRAFNQQGVRVQSGFSPTVGYGWRARPTDETNQRDRRRIQLQYFDETRGAWAATGISIPATPSTTGNWVTGSATGVQNIGFLALGDDSRIPALLSVRVLLEGAYNWYRSPQDTAWMVNNLRRDGLIPRTPPNVYPYNLDTSRATTVVNQIPSDVVDWVVIELRRNITPDTSSIFKLAFVRQDRSIVEIDGLQPLRVNAIGNYYVVVHHRNHLALMSSDNYTLAPELRQDVDLLQPGNVFGQGSGFKPLEVVNNTPVWAMYGGDINGDGKIDQVDIDPDRARITPWNQIFRDLEYILRDADMNGFVSTKDYNMSWNNRNRSTPIVLPTPR